MKAAPLETKQISANSLAITILKHRLLALKQELKEDKLILHEIIDLKFESQEMQLQNLIKICENTKTE